MVNRKDKEPNINNYKCDYYEKDMGICGYGFGDSWEAKRNTQSEERNGGRLICQVLN